MLEILREARKATGMNRHEASFLIHVGATTLGSYERGETLCPPDVILEMARVYKRPELPGAYCSNLCPIGQKLHHKCQGRDVGTTVLGVVKEFEDVKRILMDLVTVAADGEITSEEFPLFEKAVVELLDLERAIGEIKLMAQRNAGLDLAELISARKEKAPLRKAL